MPFTFIDIERRENWRIGVFFVVLLLLYFAVALCVYYFLYGHLGFLGWFFNELKMIAFDTNAAGATPGSAFAPQRIAAIFLLTLLFASIHFFAANYNAVPRLKKHIGAQEPDPTDPVHKRLMNIVDELHIAMGTRARIACLVIPDASMNALSAADINGNVMIAITEGLLAKLSREQTEAVMAHEAYHVLSGDCLEGTAATALFGLPASVLGKVVRFSNGYVLFSPLFILSMILVGLSYPLNMFISREREYRADAGAVHMTRNPLALAQALYKLSRNGRWSGAIGRGLETLCIANPSESALDESEGWVADLLSTHPPIAKRIQVLLRLAHAGMRELETEIQNGVPAMHGGESDALWPPTRVGAEEEPARQAPLLPLVDRLPNPRIANDEHRITDYACPACGHPLMIVSYEQVKLHRCEYCEGTLIEDEKLPRLIARSCGTWSDRVEKLASMTLRQNERRLAMHQFKGADGKVHGAIALLDCPKCGQEMARGFYSAAYLLEVNRCVFCNLIWFDRDELDMLLCMIDKGMALHENDTA